MTWDHFKNDMKIANIVTWKITISLNRHATLGTPVNSPRGFLGREGRGPFSCGCSRQDWLVEEVGCIVRTGRLLQYLTDQSFQGGLGQ